MRRQHRTQAQFNLFYCIPVRGALQPYQFPGAKAKQPKKKEARRAGTCRRCCESALLLQRAHATLSTACSARSTACRWWQKSKPGGTQQSQCCTTTRQHSHCNTPATTTTSPASLSARQRPSLPASLDPKLWSSLPLLCRHIPPPTLSHTHTEIRTHTH